MKDDEDDQNSEIFESLKDHIQQSNKNNLLFRLNLFPKFSEGNRKL